MEEQIHWLYKGIIVQTQNVLDPDLNKPTVKKFFFKVREVLIWIW